MLLVAEHLRCQQELTDTPLQAHLQRSARAHSSAVIMLPNELYVVHRVQLLLPRRLANPMTPSTRRRRARAREHAVDTVF